MIYMDIMANMTYMLFILTTHVILSNRVTQYDVTNMNYMANYISKMTNMAKITYLAQLTYMVNMTNLQ